jgi:hypothetical protein
MPQKRDESAAFAEEGLLYVPPAAQKDEGGDGVPDALPAAGMMDQDGDGLPDGAGRPDGVAQIKGLSDMIAGSLGTTIPTTAPSAGPDVMAQAAAFAAESAVDVEAIAKSFTVSFDRPGFATGTGPKYDEASLASTRAALLQLDATLNTLPVSIQAIRERGYIFDNSLERELATINQQWNAITPRVMDETLRRSRELTAMSVRVGQQFPWNGTGLEPPEHAKAVWELDSVISSAQSQIGGMYSGLQTHIQDVQARVQKAKDLMDQVSKAMFKLQPNEYPVAACGAQYLTGAGDEEGPKGYLFLTDQRLIFEQNEDIAKAKVLFVTTKKEHVQEVKLDVPVGAIKKIEAEDKGFMGRHDFLTMRFQEPPAPRPGARFHIWDDNQRWVALINKITSGEIDADRLGAKTVAERVAAEQAGGPAAEAKPQIPTNCPSCGAPIKVKPVRGMTSITCEFCGAPIRV